jgi:hypothetical protein
MYDRGWLPHHVLIDGLRRWAMGSYCTEAAVGLLVAHERWLQREDFCRHAIWIDGAIDSRTAYIVGVDWDVAADMLDDAPASSSERQILALAISLVAGKGHAVDLGSALTSLDVSNSARVLQAVGHAAGLHARHATVVVDGHIDERDRGSMA